MNGTASATSRAANFDVFAVDTTGKIVNVFSGSASSTLGQPAHIVRFVANDGKVCSGSSDSATSGSYQRTFRVCRASDSHVATCTESATSASFDYSVSIEDANGFLDDNF